MVADRVAAVGTPTVDTVRAVRIAINEGIAGAPARAVVDLANDLLDRADHTLRFVAYELISHHPAALASLACTDLERLGRGMASWIDVDTFSLELSGIAWRNGQIHDADIHRWAASPDRWWRRTALVSTVPLNLRARGGKGDIPRTLAVCTLLAADRDDMVVKALSWALRTIIRLDRAAVERFLTVAPVAPRVTREVRAKLDTGLKTPRRLR